MRILTCLFKEKKKKNNSSKMRLVFLKGLVKFIEIGNFEDLVLF